MVDWVRAGVVSISRFMREKKTSKETFMNTSHTWKLLRPLSSQPIVVDGLLEEVTEKKSNKKSKPFLDHNAK